MAEIVILPKQGLQMTEGTITRWLIPEGGAVQAGEPLFEMETDKLTIAIDSPHTGTLLKILHGEGETVPITRPIAVIGAAGEDISALLAGLQTDATPPPPPPPAPAAAPASPTLRYEEISPVVPDDVAPSSRILVSPRARRAAEERGIDLATLRGSGENGTIVEWDVLEGHTTAQITQTGPAGSSVRNAQAVGGETLVPFTGMRRAVADNMMASLQNSAQASHRMTVDMTEAAKIREAYRAREQKISYNDILCFVLARALLEFPRLNAVCDAAGIHEQHDVNLGVAVAVPDGLIVPTVFGAQRLSLPELHERCADLAGRAKNGGLRPGEYSGGSFTITNLGMYGLDEFTAILNPPQVGILAVGAIRETPVVVGGAVAVRPVVTLSLTYDHRAVDGAPAAQFLARLRSLLENPYAVLL